MARLLLLLSYVGFVSLGLPDTVLGGAWPALRTDLGLALGAAGPILLLTTLGVVTSSALSAAVRARARTGSVLAVSTLLAALALLATGAATRSWQLLPAALLAGLSGGAIDACLNLHVARKHSARHMSWLHACWGLGAALAPTLVATLLAGGASWRAAYALIGALELLLALAFVRTRRWWAVDDGETRGVAAPAQQARSRSAPGAQRASVLMFFLYGGLEAGAGLWSASLLIETRALSHAQAGATVAAYWAALTVGRFVIGARADALGPMRVLRATVRLALGAALVLSLPGAPAWVMIAALSLLGFSLAPIYPLAMHDTPHRFAGADGGNLVGQQVAATSLGVASLPWLMGEIASRSSLAWLPLMLTLLALGVLVLERARRATRTRPA